MDKPNPFEYGRELGLGELVDRREEMSAIDAAIRNRGKLFLIGPRRFGKTSVLSAADEAATRQGTVVLRFDAEKYESLELLAEALLTAAARALESRLDRAVSLISRRRAPEAGGAGGPGGFPHHQHRGQVVPRFAAGADGRAGCRGKSRRGIRPHGSRDPGRGAADRGGARHCC
jgi:hypothetical protein